MLLFDWVVGAGGRRTEFVRAKSGEVSAVVRKIGPDGKVSGKAVRATNDPESDYGASFAGGKLVFARTRVEMNFWALPLDSTGERLTGPPEPLTSSPARKGQESVAGSKLL